VTQATDPPFSDRKSESVPATPYRPRRPRCGLVLPEHGQDAEERGGVHEAEVVGDGEEPGVADGAVADDGADERQAVDRELACQGDHVEQRQDGGRWGQGQMDVAAVAGLSSLIRTRHFEIATMSLHLCSLVIRSRSAAGTGPFRGGIEGCDTPARERPGAS
jgi:hypothetical protein